MICYKKTVFLIRILLIYYKGLIINFFWIILILNYTGQYPVIKIQFRYYLKLKFQKFILQF